MNFLQMLLGQQAAAGMAEGPVTDLIVQGNRPAPPAAEPVPVSNTQAQTLDRYRMNLNNEDYVRARQDAVRATEAASDRRGMFGVKGTLRDVLGLVGDSYLMGQGKDPRYHAQREKERISDAMAGGELNPMAARARVGYYDPAMEQEMLSNYETQQLREAQQESLAAGREDIAEGRQYARTKDARLFAQGILAQPGAYDPETGDLTPDAQQALDIAARQAGLSVGELVGEDTSPGALRMMGEAGMTVNQQRQLPFVERRVAAGEKTAEAAERNSKRPRPGRSSNPTPTTMLRDFMAIPPEQRTSEQQDFIQRMTEPTGGGPRRPSAPSAAPKLQIKPVRN